MARPRLPSNVLELRGSFAKHPERRREREAQDAGRQLSPVPRLTRVPARPGWLDAYARAEWDALAPLMLKAGRLTELNLPAFEHMCALRGSIAQMWATGSLPPRSLLSQCRSFERAFGVAPRRAPP